ncbi:MAG: hypothetical protein DMG44_04315 [Acidobacteria bacterium]|jgi:hypothetical protein|nr:MAG: hypothetical protein DMG44_04315 [Acidobacteriota bacterium]
MSRLTVLSALFSSFIAILLIACSGNRRTACDKLVYKEEGLTRTEFLPCAAEMLVTMDKLDAHMDAVLKGDKRARAEALMQYKELGGLIKKAGGRNLVERWQDESLNRLNLRIWNAYTSFQGALMIPNDVDANAARRSKEEARSIYESLR